MDGTPQLTGQALRTVAAVLAGGTGTRLGRQQPKQLLELAGKPVIEHTIATLHANEHVDEIIVLMTPGYIDDVTRLLGDRYPKVSGVHEGGASRNASTQRALDTITAKEGNVLLHDAVRPLLTQQMIDDCVGALQNFAAVTVAIPTSDTVLEVHDNLVVSIPDRSRLRRVQTPQGFRLSTIRAAYARAWDDPDFASTDDCSVVLTYLPDVPIHVVEGSAHNIKITDEVDLAVAEQLLRSQRRGD
jgi:2-C-methyl-D-erythritol 4-phosphate cytidylyltransferase